MYKQIYYSARERLSVRLSSFIIMMAVNLLFFLLVSVWPNFALMVTAISFSGLALAYVLIANAGVSFFGFHELFRAPKSYFTLLAPVPVWQILLGKALPSVIIDVVSGQAAILWVLWFAFTFTGLHSFIYDFISVQDVFFAVFTGLFGYFMLLMVFCFFRALSKSVFYRAPLSALWAVITAVFVSSALSNVLNLLLIPFGHVHRFFVFFHISLHPTPAADIMYLLILLLQAAILFLLNCHLMERKINI